MTTRAFLKRHLVTGAMFTVLAAAGCGADADPEAEISAQPSDVAVTTAASPSSSPSSTSEAAPATPEATEDPAGGDQDSCGDGECEVSFTGSVEFPLAGADGEWTVAAAVEEDGVMVNLTRPTGLGGGGGLLYHAECTLVIRADGGGSLSCDEAPPEPEPGGIVVHLVELNGRDATVQAALG